LKNASAKPTIKHAMRSLIMVEPVIFGIGVSSLVQGHGRPRRGVQRTFRIF